MDTVTYPNESVSAYLDQHFVGAKFNTANPEAVRDVARQFRPLWTPTFVFLDHHGIEVRRVVGYLPPEEFIVELMLARANAALLGGRYADSFNLFRQVVDEYPGSPLAPEAMYYAGVAGYRRDGKNDELLTQWRLLRDTHHASTWWTRASFIADSH